MIRGSGGGGIYPMQYYMTYFCDIFPCYSVGEYSEINHKDFNEEYDYLSCEKKGG